MSDTTETLLAERAVIRELLAAWWRRWIAQRRAAGAVGDPGAALYPIDDWARETPEETAARIASSSPASSLPPAAGAPAASGIGRDGLLRFSGHTPSSPAMPHGQPTVEEMVFDAALALIDRGLRDIRRALELLRSMRSSEPGLLSETAQQASADQAPAPEACRDLPASVSPTPRSSES